MSELVKPFSLVRQAVGGLRLTHQEVADVLGCSVPHVRALCYGKYAESLSPKQIHNLLNYCRLVREEVIQSVLEMETLA